MNFQAIIATLEEVFEIIMAYVLSPDKRTYWVYFISSFVLALYVYFRYKEKESFVSYFFNRKRWLGKSAWVDYLLIFFNSLVKVIVLAPILIYALYWAEGFSQYLANEFGAPKFNFSATSLIIAYTIIIVVINDFFTFIIHYAMHKIPFLWEFHKIHHSATELTPFTQYRMHPIELIINNLKGIVVKAVVTGFFLYIANGNVSLVTLLGINILNFLFYFFGANLRHSHVKLKYFNFLENILISPYQHQIHHSNNKAHFDANLGSRLAIWDYLFGTLIKSKDVKELKFGLGEEDKDYDTFSKNLLHPFKNTFKHNKP